ncbi:MAG: hypothetical protein KAH34_06450, partial [Ketobacter sp.]|nr:hypothetical protein [Ketobacter sp.]
GDAASANLKANAHAEMALLVHSPLDKEAKNKLCLQANTGPMASCKAALKLDDNDSSVLWKTGKIYRNYRDKFKARKLLEKAVDLQPSSAAYHQLGLTYKAMATDYQYGKLKTRRSGRRVKERRRAKEEKLRSLGVEGVPEPSSKARALGTARENRERDKVDRIKKTIKSPKGTTQFDPEDDNVQMAIDNLKLAVKFSHGENSRALYDLALMHKATGNNDDALKRFAEIGKVGTSAGLLDQITALEQRGLIYEDMSDRTADAEQKKKLIEKKESMLNRALSRLAELYSTTAEVKYLFGKLFHSPSALLKAADAALYDAKHSRNCVKVANF